MKYYSNILNASKHADLVLEIYRYAPTIVVNYLEQMTIRIVY
jgi:hypothetical protein